MRAPLTTHLLKLDGGPDAVLAEMPGAHTAVASVCVGAGPAFEREANNGISHLLEHLVLSGRASHPTRRAFQSAVESLGGYLQGMTHKEYTEYSFVCHPAELEQALTLLGAAVAEPGFNEEALDTERQVVLEEMLSGQNEGGLDPYTQLLWGSHSLGLPIIGRREVVEGLSLGELTAYHRDAYHGGNLVVAVAGAVGPDVVRRGLEAFNAVPCDGGLPERRQVEREDCPRLSVDRFRSVMADACILYRTPGWDHHDARRHTLLQLLTQVFHGRLHPLVGPRMPVYHFYAGQEVYVPEGHIYFVLNAGPARFSSSLERVLRELDELRRHGVGAAELEHSRRRYELSILAQRDDPWAVASWLGPGRLLCGRERSVDIEQELSHLADVSVGEMNALARETLVRSAVHVILRGGMGWFEARRLRRLVEAWFGD